MSTGDIEQKRRAFALFKEVVELVPDARTRRLDEACAGDAELRARVEALLQADAGDAEPFSGNASSWSSVLQDDDPARTEDPLLGRSIGAWRITGVLGRGGMGAVYAVERADGAYAQQAALKLIRTGADSPAARERFLRERQTLARLQHPHIATLLDGGFSTEGDPYFVMEQVIGTPLDRWADQRKLDLRQRVVLFLQVLDAVQYAHRNLVVHRDLKPSNLLVTEAGQVKLLDFGIARHLQDAGLTATSDRALTLEYAAPEQLHDEPITTATDLYQLGVVLYRLLSGAHPFRLEADTPLARQLQALSRDAQPITRSAQQSAGELAAVRGHTPASLARALGGNLAEIVHACLRRNPEMRYASAESIANDLRAWLDDRPIAAVRLGRSERMRLWLRRNRLLAASLSAVALALLVGTGIALWQAREAREQARIAERENGNARAALTFLSDTLAAASPERAGSKEVSVRQLLDRARANLDQRALEPQVRQPVQRMLGRLYLAIAEQQQAVEVFAAGLKDVDPGQRDEALALADDLVVYSDALADLERNAEAFAVAEQAVALRRRFAPDDPEQQLRAMAHLTLGHVEKYGLDACRKQAEAALALAMQMRDPPIDVVLDIYSDLSVAANFQNDRRRLLSVSREGLAYADRHGIPADSPVRQTLTRSLVSGLVLEGKHEEAERVVRQAITDGEKTGGYGDASETVLYQALAETLMGQGRYREALQALDKSYALSSDAGEGPRNLAMALTNIAALNLMYGDYATALERSTQGMSQLATAGIPADDVFRRSAERTHARTLIANDRFDEAAHLLDSLLERARRLDGVASEEYALVLGERMGLYRRVGDAVRGVPLLADLRARMARRGVADTHEQFGYFFIYEAVFDRHQGDAAAAEQHQREAVRRLESSASATDIAIARATLAGDVAARGDKVQAKALLANALPVMRAALLPTERNLLKAERLSTTL